MAKRVFVVQVVNWPTSPLQVETVIVAMTAVASVVAVYTGTCWYQNVTAYQSGLLPSPPLPIRA